MFPYILLLLLTNGTAVATIPQASSDICEKNGRKYTSGYDHIAWKYQCIPTEYTGDPA